MFELFEEKYKDLNIDQKKAVQTIDGLVMVVAGPGTGKTQVLALRIAYILKNTDSKPEDILCLTFTNSGVEAMRTRLESYIGTEAYKVKISTFHSFAISTVEKYYELLDFKKMPSLLSDDEKVFLIDNILHTNDFEYLRPRTDPSLYFKEINQLVSILKRERITPAIFLEEVESEILKLEKDPNSISSRGESKGTLKKEILKKIESLSRTKEVVEFYKLYEQKKKEECLMDYDDVLEYVVDLAEKFDDVRDDIRENYLYILVDEHQDSSNVQNSFLKAVWGDVEQPNIFVVGDDRQLIYGFSGASLSYFEEFAHMFGKATLITLKENYRSTAPILSLADTLLASSITKDKLNSNKKGDTLVSLNEYVYPRDEILGAGIYFKKLIDTGVNPKECAILVPKNYHVRSAITTLSSIGLPVSSGKSISLFSQKQTDVFLRILGIIANPNNSILIAQSLLDSESNIDTLEAHTFLRNQKGKEIFIENLIGASDPHSMFPVFKNVSDWGNVLKDFVNIFSDEKITYIVSVVGNKIFVDGSKNTEELLKNVEVVRSFIHLATMFEEKHKKASLADFIEYINRLDSYGTHIELATFGKNEGIEVMTLHKSKGLEYSHVWIAHMNEEVLMSEKKRGFTLPEKINEHMQTRDIESAKRELYVAITRAKEFCTISYASEGYTGNNLELAHIIKDIPSVHFIKNSKEETEKIIKNEGVTIYTQNENREVSKGVLDIVELVKNNYTDIKVSVTMLNNFFECPWKWYFRNFLKLPEIKTTSLALGSAVHSTIEFILKAQSLPTDIAIKEKIKFELLKEGGEENSSFKKLEKDAFEAVDSWIKDYYKNLSEDFKTERSLSIKDKDYPLLTMYGKIDLTERLPNGNIVVSDFKTGKSKTSSVIEKINEDGRLSDLMRQLAMYSYLIQGSDKGAIISQSRLLFLEAESSDKNKIYSTFIDQEKIDLLKKDIKEYNDLLSSGEWVKNECHFKSYGKGDECEYCKRSKLFKN